MELKPETGVRENKTQRYALNLVPSRKRGLAAEKRTAKMAMAPNANAASPAALFQIISSEIRDLLNGPIERVHARRVRRSLKDLGDSTLHDIGFDPLSIRSQDPFRNTRFDAVL